MSPHPPNFLLRSTGVVLLFCASLQASPQVGTELNIGPTGSGANTISGANGGAIGTGNLVGPRSLAVGNQNSLYVNGSVNAANSLAVGSGNWMHGNSSMTVGSANWNSADNSLVVGIGNSSTGANSLTIGDSNQNVGAANSLIAGFLNSASSSSGSGATLGQYLVNKWSTATVVGSYNSQTVTESLEFVVGAGSVNGFEVHTDGKIVMPARQGDLLMGPFGSNGD